MLYNCTRTALCPHAAFTTLLFAAVLLDDADACYFAPPGLLV
jgi:hypothetical protein